MSYTILAQTWIYRDQGLGSGEDKWLTTGERESPTTNGETEASIPLAAARALAAYPLSAPGGRA